MHLKKYFPCFLLQTPERAGGHRALPAVPVAVPEHVRSRARVVRGAGVAAAAGRASASQLEGGQREGPAASCQSVSNGFCYHRRIFNSLAFRSASDFIQLENFNYTTAKT